MFIFSTSKLVAKMNTAAVDGRPPVASRKRYRLPLSEINGPSPGTGRAVKAASHPSDTGKGKIMALEDTVLQADTDTTIAPAAPAAPADTAAATPVEADPDLLELETARTAIAAPASDTTKPAPAATAAAPAAAAPAAADPASPVEAMIPKVRFDQEIGKNAAKDATIAAQRGEIEALKLVRPATTAAAPVATPPADQLVAARAEAKALAKRFDDGELSMSEYVEQSAAIEDKVFTIREQATLARVKESLPAPAPVQDLLLDERTQQLEELHPYTKEITSPDDWKFLHRKAVDQLTAEGVEIPEGDLNPRERLIVRERIAKLTDVYGELLTGKKLDLTAKPAPASTPAPKPGPSATATARSDKLQAAAAAPPDISRIGSGGTGDEQYTEERINSMGDEEITALPISIRRKFLATE